MWFKAKAMPATASCPPPMCPLCKQGDEKKNNSKNRIETNRKKDMIQSHYQCDTKLQWPAAAVWKSLKKLFCFIFKDPISSIWLLDSSGKNTQWEKDTLFGRQLKADSLRRCSFFSLFLYLFWNLTRLDSLSLWPEIDDVSQPHSNGMRNFRMDG